MQEGSSWEDFDDKNWPTLQSAVRSPPPASKPLDPLPDEQLRSSHPYFAAQPKVRILTRNNKPDAGEPSLQSRQIPLGETTTKSYEERQQEYERARAAIFNDKPSAPPSDVPAKTSPTTDSNQPRRGVTSPSSQTRSTQTSKNHNTRGNSTNKRGGTGRGGRYNK